MTGVEELITDARKKKLRVAQLYEGTDGVWRCFLYRRANEPANSWASGHGKDAADALAAALINATAAKKPSIARFEALL